MKISKFLLVIIFSFCFLQVIQAQDVLRLKGWVVEEGTTQRIPFVTVRIKGVALGTITEIDGRFAIKVPLRYASDTLIFSSVGYKQKEIAIADLKEKVDNEVTMEIYVEQLSEVTVQRGRQRKPLKVLKKAISKIQSNYPQKTFTFDAYYREQIVENGATIKFADAATTFQQGAYTGNSFSQGLNSGAGISVRTGVGTGMLTSGLFGLRGLGERLHDHFGHRTSKQDRVKIHDARASFNLTKEGMQANIEGGPLSTLSKDLVRYLSHFMYKNKFKKYEFELYESPDEDGNWDYVVRFKPKRAAASLEKIQTNLKKGRRISRNNILSGAIHIDQDSYAIKRLTYSVDQNYRGHICNFNEMNIKHYGYEVDVRYKPVNDRWQIDKIKRIDEFIFKDTIKGITTPYSTITEIITSDQPSELSAVSGKDNFANVDVNYLHGYPLDYNPEFWVAYEQEMPEATLSAAMREDMEAEASLEKQFELIHTSDENMLPPVAEKEPVVTNWYGTRLTDDYQWLKDTKAPKSNPRVMEYLKAENDYTKNYFIPLRKTERLITTELFNNIDREAKSDPVKNYGYWYWSKYLPDADYPTIYRKKDEKGVKEEVLFDLPQLADSLNYFSLGFYAVSPDNKYMAYSIDTVGRQSYMTYIKDMETGIFLSDSIKDTDSFLWAEDSQGFFYTKIDKKRNRTHAIVFHLLGTSFNEDTTYLKSDDITTNVGIRKTRSREFLMLSVQGNNTGETYISRNKFPYQFKLIKAAEPDRYYSFNHVKDKFYISTNIGASNGRLMSTDTVHTDFEYWKEVVAGSDEEVLMGTRVFDNYLVVHKMRNLKERIEIRNLNSGKVRILKGPKAGQNRTLSLGRNKLESDTLHYYVSAPNYPTHKVSYHLGTGKSKVIRKDKGGSFLNSLYKTKILWADARDGTKVPITILYMRRKERHLKNRPMLVEGYGAYGAGGNLGFNSGLTPLIDRGVVYAYVHVRGGGDLGDQWYKAGKMKNKTNSFTDFIDATEYLKANGIGDAGQFYASGGSAGGLLMGAVINMRPDLFQGVFLDVPFVDVINTMADESLPLTAGEYEEWGNPNKKQEFKYIAQYSPYENVKAQKYPRLAFYTGINDKNVGYWEPSKMVAKLRAMKTDDNILLLNIGMNAGHGAGSGRMAGIRLQAYKYTLMLEWIADVKQKK